jgi:hypothetical protein
MKGGDIGSFIKPVASAVLDIAAPAFGAYVGGPIGATLAKGIREGVRGVTGYGKGKKKITNSDTITAGSNCCTPCKMKGCAKSAGAKSAGAKSAGAKSAGGKKNRMTLVKQVMKEKGLKLGAASKYVKDNNLY